MFFRTIGLTSVATANLNVQCVVCPGYECETVLILEFPQIPANIHFKLSEFFSSVKNAREHH